MCLWLAKPFFVQREFQEGLNVVYNVDKDGKPTKYTRIVERVMQCVTDKTTIFAEPFLSMKSSRFHQKELSNSLIPIVHAHGTACRPLRRKSTKSFDDANAGFHALS